MDLLQRIRQLERLDQLIRLKATGSPGDLARRLCISRRQIFRLIHELKEIGLPIGYCKARCSYYYNEAVIIHFEIRVQKENIIKIKGGKH